MNTFLYLLQLTILMALLCSALMLLAGFLGGFIVLSEVIMALKWTLPSLIALSLAFVMLSRTHDIEDHRAVARFNSVVLAAGCGLLTVWAYRVNRRVNGVTIRRISGAAWSLIVATGLVTVIESTNMIFWSATELVVLGVLWLDIVLILQVAVLGLVYTRGRTAAAFRVQPDSAAYHPNGSPNAYPDAGYYRLRVAPGKPDSRRHPHPRGDRRPVTNTPARPNTDARYGNRVAHAPRKP